MHHLNKNSCTILSTYVPLFIPCTTFDSYHCSSNNSQERYYWKCFDPEKSCDVINDCVVQHSLAFCFLVFQQGYHSCLVTFMSLCPLYPKVTRNIMKASLALPPGDIYNLTVTACTERSRNTSTSHILKLGLYLNYFTFFIP